MKLSRVDRIKQTGASMIILKQYNSTDCNGYDDDTYDKDTGSDGDAKTNKIMILYCRVSHTLIWIGASPSRRILSGK